jgi:diguanylate cyclase (GGDEF)-like protein/PAS domain S-box-containing protein
MRHIAGHDPESLIGRQASPLIAPEDRVMASEEHRAIVQSPGTTRTFRYRGLLADGSKRWFETHARAICDEDGRADGTLSFVRDITESKTREEHLSAAALTDMLTGLPNRRALLEHAETRRSGAGPGDCIALLDIDHFKQVNDLYGHDAGDEVLKSFAQMLRGLLRPADMPARLGGEEFVILFADTSAQVAMQICDRLREHVAATPIGTAHGSVRITVSGGVAPLTPAGMESALRTADAALYKAKHCGRDQFRLAA